MSTCKQAMRARRKAVNDTRYKPQFKTRLEDKVPSRGGKTASKGGKSK